MPAEVFDRSLFRDVVCGRGREFVTWGRIRGRGFPDAAVSAKGGEVAVPVPRGVFCVCRLRKPDPVSGCPTERTPPAFFRPDLSDFGCERVPKRCESGATDSESIFRHDDRHDAFRCGGMSAADGVPCENRGNRLCFRSDPSAGRNSFRHREKTAVASRIDEKCLAVRRIITIFALQNPSQGDIRARKGAGFICGCVIID